MLKMAASQDKTQTKQSFSKAVKRVITKLTSSTCKQDVAVESLASEFRYQGKLIRRPPDKANNEKVYLNKQFYFRSDIVYTIPGNGDEMTVWDDNGKHKLQKYYLTMYLKEAYAIFLESCENEDDRCSVSTFCNLNPKNVLLLGDSPKAVLFI